MESWVIVSSDFFRVMVGQCCVIIASYLCLCFTENVAGKFESLCLGNSDEKDLSSCLSAGKLGMYIMRN